MAHLVGRAAHSTNFYPDGGGDNERCGWGATDEEKTFFLPKKNQKNVIKWFFFFPFSILRKFMNIYLYFGSYWIVNINSQTQSLSNEQ